MEKEKEKRGWRRCGRRGKGRRGVEEWERKIQKLGVRSGMRG